MIGTVQRTWLPVSVLMLGFGLVLGCGAKTRLEVAPVSGRVEFQGQGVPRATVIFHPAGDATEGAKRLRPFGYADDNGDFVMKTYVSGDGAPPGKYRVSIVAASVAPRESSGPSKDGAVQESAPSGSGPRIPPAVSAKYANIETSGITVEIKEQDNKLEPFQLQ